MTQDELIAERTAIYAQLLDHFHLTFEQIGNLTDCQIYNYYFHTRDERGQIVKAAKPTKFGSEKPRSMKEELLQVDVLGSTFGLKPDNIIEMKEKIRAKWAGKDK